MFNYGIGFERPWYLLLLALLPVLWIFSYRSLAGLGNVRRLMAIGLRSLVLLLLILALAEIQWRRTSDRLVTIYCLDQSESVPLVKRNLMLEYVVREVKSHRRSNDQAGVIVFGRDAVIEVPPLTGDLPTVGRIEARLGRTDATNLESALKLAQASFPEGSMRRVVVVTDGNENIGNARAIAPKLADSGIGIDVVPVELGSRSEVMVEKLVAPNDARKGQPLDMRIVLSAESDSGQPVRGKVKVTREVGRQPTLIAEEEIEVDPSQKKVLNVPHIIDESGAYNYRVVFTPTNPEDDLLAQNNQASAFVHVRGKGRVLFIEDANQKGDFDFLVQKLREKEIEVQMMATNELFTDLSELQAFDTVVLANVPRSSGEGTMFSDKQISELVRNTEQFGAGLVMLGGPDSFGAGGWSNTELEKAMPIDFQVKNTKIQAVGALVLMMHASELPQGNYWQKVVGQNSIKMLGPMDYCGLLHFDDFGSNAWLWNGLIRVGDKRRTMLAKVNRMVPGDMPDFDPSMKMALTAFNKNTASIKKMIVISDGDPNPPSNTLVNQFKKAQIRVSTVAIGTHGPAGSAVLQNLATATGGKYYAVTNPKALPQIYTHETREVSRPVIFEKDGIQPEVTLQHEILEGITTPPPPIRGFVLSQVKDNSLAEVILRSSQPDPENGTILAAWTYKAGRTAVLTTDAGKRWTDAWTSWENYDKFFSQLINWSMRPVNEEDKFSVSTDIKDGKVRVVINALDKNDEFLNFLNMSASCVGPDPNKPFDVQIRQVAPGRYAGEFDAGESGNYLMSIHPGPDHGSILTGVSVPYSAEYREKEANLALLSALAELHPKGGKAGEVIQRDGGFQSSGLPQLLEKFNTFRQTLAKAVSSQAVWPVVALLAGAWFFFDVLIRRVTPSYEWIAPAVQFVREKILRREALVPAVASIDRLRSRKEVVRQQIDERRAASRFEPQVDAESGQGPTRDLSELVDGGRTPSATPPRPAGGQTMTPTTTDESDYTQRLFAAKRRALKGKENKE